MYSIVVDTGKQWEQHTYKSDRLAFREYEEACEFYRTEVGYVLSLWDMSTGELLSTYTITEDTLNNHCYLQALAR